MHIIMSLGGQGDAFIMCLDFDPTILPSSLSLARASGCSQREEVTNAIVGQGGGGGIIQPLKCIPGSG